MHTAKPILFLIVLCLVVGGCRKRELASAVNAEMLPLKEKVITGYTTGKGGVELFVRIQGKGQPTIVLPGGPGYSFDYLVPYLSELDSVAQLIFLDPRGCGRSMRFRNPSAYTLDEMVADVESLRTHLNLAQLNIIGHETGGLLAQKYAIKYPQRVYKMILMSTTGQVSDLNIWLNNYRDFLPRQMAAMVKAYEKDSLMQGEEYNPGYERLVMQGMMNSQSYFVSATAIPENFSLPERSWPVYFAMWGRNGYFDISGNIKDIDTRNDLKTLRIGTLILVGERDYISPFVMESLTGSIPKAKIYSFENTGHFYYIEKHAEFIDQVKKFLAD